MIVEFEHVSPWLLSAIDGSGHPAKARWIACRPLTYDDHVSTNPLFCLLDGYQLFFGRVSCPTCAVMLDEALTRMTPRWRAAMENVERRYASGEVALDADGGHTIELDPSPYDD